MKKSKHTQSLNNSPSYIIATGIVWIVLAIIVLTNKDVLKGFQAALGYSQPSIFIGLCIAFLPGAYLLAYGILLREVKPDLRPLRIGIFSLVTLIVSLLIYSWVNFFVNF